MFLLEGDDLIFIQEYVKTRDAGKAWCMMKGIEEKPTLVHKRAGLKHANENAAIKQIVKLITFEVGTEGKLTLDSHLKMLANIRELGIQQGKLSVALNAEIARGKAAGLYVERREIGIGRLDDLSTDELVEKLKSVEGQTQHLEQLQYIDHVAKEQVGQEILDD